MTKLIAAVALTFGLATVALAGVGVAPEIDPGSALSALALLSTGLFMVRRRRR